MIKFCSTASDGSKLLAMVVEEANFEKMRDGQPLLVEIGQLVPEIKVPLTLLVHYSFDIKQTANDLEKGMDIFEKMGDFEKRDGPLICLVGLPLSGKTTFAKHHYIPRGYSIVCPDEVRRAIHGQRFIESSEPFIWATVYAMADALLLAGNKVIIDATNTTEKRREPWRKRKAQFVHINTSKELCIERAKAIGDNKIIPIIDRMAEQFEPLLVQ